ncbi:MAG: Yqey-like protein [Alphaproteobacteria bacterium ADurb.Bin438]|nr:MAG: Yqey-like protein [Alphaproteobacteria bacterium ADurb.Bin438]
MLREELSSALKDAMKSKESSKLSTIRLILAAIKDRDIAARTADNRNGISDDDILSLLQSMIKQRRESIDMYTKGKREDLAAEEQKEIEVISLFLPKQLSDEEIETAVNSLVAELNLNGIKDMGKAMAGLREKYAGQMDFGKASGFLKNILNKK